MADMPMPDLSNLTEEERRQIEEVMMRQKHEEAKDMEVVQNLANEVKQIEQRVILQKTQQPFGGLLSDPSKDGLCDICQKVKFSDGIGHQCNFCRLHCCVRCGARVPTKTGKSTWICSLCKKKQELLKKTGQWYHGNPVDQLTNALLSPNASLSGGPPGSAGYPPQNGSSSGPGGSLSHRQQYPLHRQKSHDPGGSSYHAVSSSLPHSHSQLPPGASSSSAAHQQQLLRQQTLRRRETIDQSSAGYGSSGGGSTRDEDLRSSRRQGGGVSSVVIRQGSVAADNSHQTGASRRDSSRTRSTTGSTSARRAQNDPFEVLHAPPPRRPESQGASRGRGYEGNSSEYASANRGALRRAQSHDRYGSQDYAEDYDPRRGASYDAWQRRSSPDQNITAHNHGLVPSRASSVVPSAGNHPAPTTVTAAAGSRRYGGGVSGGNGGVEDRRRTYQQCSFSSEDDLQSNISEFTMADDGSVRSYSSEQSTRTHPDLRHVNNSRASNRRMWRQSSQQEQGYYSQEGYSVSGDSRTCEVSWRPSDDGRRMIGHVILRKDHYSEMSMGRRMNVAAALGLRIEGGKMTPSGRLTAVIVRVKRDSVAEVTGQLRPGDEVLEWNTIPLRGLSFQEVYDIIEDSRNDTAVELMISRRIGSELRPAPYFRSHQQSQEERRFSPQPALGLTHSDAVAASSAAVHHQAKFSVPYVSGRIQLSFYYSHSEAQLAVTVIQAAALLPRPDGSARNAYAKLYLLPNRSEQTKRRTKIISKTNDPQWKQIFYYAPLKESELEDLTLEIMVWDYERYKQTSNEFIGEVLIGLGSDWRNDCPAWYYLTYPDTGLENRRAAPRRGGYEDPDFSTYSSFDGISPAHSSASRLSDNPMDNYISDADMMEVVDRRRPRAYTQLSNTHYGSPSQRMMAQRSQEYLSPVESSRMLEREHQRSGRESPHGLLYDTNRGSQDRRGRRELYDEGPHDDVRQSRAASRRHTSAPPVSDESYYYMEEPGSPPGSTSSLVRKRHLPTVPSGPAMANSSSAYQFTNTTSRRASINPGGPLLSGDEQQLLNSMPLHPPLSPSNVSRHSQSKAPIMQQFHNQTLKVPGSEDEASSVVGPRHPKMELLKKNSSQEENIDPHLMQMTEAELVPDTRMSRSSSRRSTVRKPSASLSRSSEPTDGDMSLLVPHSESRHRKLSESVPRMQSLDLDESASQQSGGMGQKSASNTDMFAKKEFNYEEFQNKFLEQQTTAKDRKTKSSAKAAAILGLKKDSKRPTFSRSEEVGHQSPASMQRGHLHKQMSKDSTDGSISSSGCGGSRGGRIDHQHLATFVDGLGPGQMVGRQVLALPCLGEIQLHLKHTKGNLEVEVVRAKGLVVKGGNRQLPATYVKVLINEDKRVIAKQKTAVARRSLDPLYQQSLMFDEVQNLEHCNINVTIWGDLGRMEKKLFMGTALISLDELDLSTIIIGWYKLFDAATVLAPNSKTSLYAASVSGVGSNNSSMDDKSSLHAANRANPTKT